MLCQNCGRMINDSKFCPYCGVPAAAAAETVPATPVVEEEPAAVCAAPVAEEVIPAAPLAEEPAACADVLPVAEAPAQPVYTEPAAEPAEIPAQPVRPQFDLSGKFKTVFGDALLLVVAILESAAAVLSLFSGSGLPVFQILFTIGLWLSYGAAKSKKPVFGQTGLKMVSGTVKAMKIVYWVIAGLLALSGILGAVGVTVMDAVYPFGSFGYLPLYGAGVVVAITFIVLAAAFAVLDVLFVYKLHRFAKSICVSAETGYPAFVKVKAARQWMFVMGIIAGAAALIILMSAFSGAGLLTFLVTGSSAAAMIVASLWVKKYFPDC